MREIVYTDKAPSPIGPYSQAIKCSGEMLFLSGQIALDENGELNGGIVEQTQISLNNLKTVLEAAEFQLKDVVKVTVLLVDINDFAKMNDEYEVFFGDSKPARAAYQVSALPKGALVEIEAVACR
ncbi:Rid family detoxifying hydrolase [Candidatus Kapabacteria bacterium]|nr:Rid family detoxifying hydrolase [Candidatus Kapabacteria bacterium]